ncbi:MAG: phenylalanine--tRNA ligase subunit alpha [candidate division KSB1 bacterium]|nr:phenylalanine--tRNA ligase subunit alpha [candidate division KSB1 bacterium]
MGEGLTELLAEVEGQRKAFARELAQAGEPRAVDEVRVRYLGRKGVLARYFDVLPSLGPEDRRRLGKTLNELRTEWGEALARRREELIAPESEKEEVDYTLPGLVPFIGARHPVLQVMDRIKEIFYGMGFTVEEGPEIEDDYHNFEALNVPADHPSRDLQDTFYLESPFLMRTHTSPVQIRTMERCRPPVRMIAPGRCYRKDTPDATHSPVFHQVEGLCVDEGVTFADLKGVVETFAKRLFGPEVRIRFRPSFFPFTEPSAEYDFSCIMCGGKGCRVCKGTGWLEISGAGMVDPAVFRFVGYDPEKYTGYAFGMGVERIAMLMYQVDDIRLFYDNDLRFLQQF